MDTAMLLESIARNVECAEPMAHCQVDLAGCQIVVTFDKRPDVEVALLIPMAQSQVKKGHIDQDLYSDMLFAVRRIANNNP